MREDLAALSRALELELAAGRDGIDLARLRAERLDVILAAHFARACAAVSSKSARPPIVLAAAGSYGRGAMALASDVDVRLVAVGETKSSRALADAILYPLWDAGLSLGHQLALPREMLALANEDLPTATSLFDLRAIAGDTSVVRALVEKFVARMKPARTAQDFARRLADDTKKRHERYGDSVYLLEPDVKLGRGGFRDLDVARWILAPFAQGEGADPLDVLVARGALDPRELRAALDAEAFAWRVRNRLHAIGKRRSDRLTFDAQETLAEILGYVSGSGEEALARGTERFMQAHYVHARAISRVHDRATSVATRRPRSSKKTKDLGGGLLVASGAVSFFDSSALAKDPAVAMRAYAACVRGDLPLGDVTRDAISRAMAEPSSRAALRESPEATALFVELLCEVRESPALGGSIARELHDVGILLAMIPEFLPVTGRVHHDVYHVLTVDVHSVAALDCLRGLARGELAESHALASRLGAEIVRRRPLFLATLLHDVGKGHPARKNHSVSGAELCDVVLPRLGFTREETLDARALVLHHLAMYHLATRRDLDDRATAEELVRIVRGREGLRDLFLLTIADITTTSPAAMTSWKAHMLEELYLRAEAILATPNGGAPDRAIDEERVARVAAEVEGLGAPPDFISSMPARYVLATRASSIAAHAKLANARGERAAIVGRVERESDRLGHDFEVCVVARDRHGLLARIAAALAASRLEISAAHVSTRTNGRGEREAVDVFFVHDQATEHGDASRKLAQVEKDLVALSEDHIAPSELLASRQSTRASWAVRKTPDVQTKIVFDGRTSPQHTIIEVFAKDQPGLLFRLARALEDAGLSITLSKINTEGTKVADVFYVQERDGRKVEDPARLKEIHERLIDAVR